MSNARSCIVLTAILAISAALASCMLTSGHDWGDDFASYLMQARSIVDGNVMEFIKHNSFTIQNSDFPIGPIAYPWGYPLLLAPIYMSCGLNLYALKGLNVLLFLGFLVCIYSLVSKDRCSKKESLLLTSLFALNPVMLSFQDNILSDIPFLFFSTLTLLLIDRFVIQNDRECTIAQTIAIGVAAFAAYFVRSNGIFLLGVLFLLHLIQIWRNRTASRWNQGPWKNLIFAYVVFFILAGIYSLLFPGGEGSYIALHHFINGSELQTNVIFYLNIWRDFFSAIPFAEVISKVLIIFFIIGLLHHQRRDFLLKFYFVLTLSAFILYPFPQGIRFVFPILPIFIYLAHKGMTAVLSALSLLKTSTWIPAALWMIVIVMFAWNSVDIAEKNLKASRKRGGPFDEESLQMYSFIQEKTAPNSVALFFKPRVFRLMTGRDAAMVNRCTKLYLGDYIILNLTGDAAPGEYSEQLSPADLQKCNVPLKPVFQNDNFSAFQILK